MCKEGEKKAAQNLLKTDLRPVTSCLQGVKGGSQLSHSMKRAILEVRETERKTLHREEGREREREREREQKRQTALERNRERAGKVRQRNEKRWT